eukprot:771956-Amphidinium_carterae.1
MNISKSAHSVKEKVLMEKRGELRSKQEAARKLEMWVHQASRWTLWKSHAVKPQQARQVLYLLDSACESYHP